MRELVIPIHARRPRPPRRLRFQDWDAFPDTPTRFADAFGVEAVRHWGLSRRPTTVSMFGEVLKEVFASEAISQQFYEHSPFLSKLEAA